MGISLTFDQERQPARPKTTWGDVIHRLQTTLLTAFAVSAGAAFITYLVLALMWYNTPFFGAMLSPTLIVTAGQPAAPRGEPWQGLDAGLQARDRILAVNGVRLDDLDYGTAFTTLTGILRSANFGDDISVEFQRRDEVPQVISYPLERFPAADFLIFFVIPYISGIVGMVIAGLLLYLRPRSPGALSAVLACLPVALYMGGIFDAGSTQSLTGIWVFAGSLMGGAIITLGLTFPTRMAILYRLPWLGYVPLIVSVGVGLFTMYNLYAPPTPQAYSLSYQLASSSPIIGSLLLVFLLIIQRRQAITARIRHQSGAVLIGIILALIPGVIWVLGQILNVFDPGYMIPFNFEASMPFLLSPLLALGYAVLQDEYIDTDVALSRMITYSILMFVLLMGYFLATLGASLLLVEFIPNNPLLIALTLFVVSVLFIPVRGRLQDRVDAIYYMTRRDYQAQVEAYSQRISQLNGQREIIDEFRRLTQEALFAANVLVFLPNKIMDDEFYAFGSDIQITFSPDGGLVKHLIAEPHVQLYAANRPVSKSLMTDRARINVLKPEVIAGMTNEGRLIGMVMVGASLAHNVEYGYEEMRFLSAMINQLSVAVERAQVIDSLSRSVDELNVLSQVSEALNFAITFDDLLELIYAQTMRLITSTYFYIALYDMPTSQLYFAFYLEGDDRLPERENLRWQLGQDVFSQTVRTGQPVRIADYRQALEGQEYRAVFESTTQTSIKALMAVPLSAQGNKLGVLATARTTGDPYTSDQIKVFTSIANLAATALDRVRLFSEANVRARQLAALNSISQKLVAAESQDVKALLQLITSSAADLLVSEAASLLLVVDEETRDLEFQVVVGGSGQDLIGKRLAATHGLVGEVMQTGQPQISNNTISDERWKGDIAQGFRTESILAVPLIAKDKIIGVLEVLNKKDGTAFQDEEVELLTTLSGQAAIAIENARLFQMTGTALSESMEELQMLERIDRDLARELNIDRVAAIAIKWAVANTGATAALLGEVHEPSERLYVRAIHGYRTQELPQGWEKEGIPLNVGIVRRVLRTKFADLADPTVDPDYTPGLTSANSQITVPMMSGESVIAVMVLESNHEPRMNLLDLEFMKRLAERASIAFANAQLYDKTTRAAETKSQFVGFAAHELKNPLTSIMSYANLYNAMPDPTIRDNAIDVIKRNALRMQSIIDDMRDIAKSDAGKFAINAEPIAALPIVQDTILPFRQLIMEKEQTIINNVAHDLPLLMGDHAKLVQVMVNLVSNAHKYSPPEATITVSATVEQEHIDPRGKKYGSVIRLSIADTGIGMSPEDVARLFNEDYFRSENELAQQQKGTGLGMIITERIITAHGGRIWVESELGVGTTFSFVIPLAPQEKQNISANGTGAIENI